MGYVVSTKYDERCSNHTFQTRHFRMVCAMLGTDMPFAIWCQNSPIAAMDVWNEGEGVAPQWALKRINYVRASPPATTSSVASALRVYARSDWNTDLVRSKFSLDIFLMLTFRQSDQIIAWCNEVSVRRPHITCNPTQSSYAMNIAHG